MEKAAQKSEENNERTVKVKNSIPLSIRSEITKLMRRTITIFKNNKNGSAAAEIEKIYKDAARDCFSVSVVGEFSKGKSTFINALLNKNFLPIGDLPTTAIMTRIRPSAKEVLVWFDSNGKRLKELPLSVDSWEGLTADNFYGRDPFGTVLAGLDSEWRARNNIEIIDTPGSGDLEEERAKLIGEALLGSDGAIITISASAALSMSEKLFIEQRLISRKTPFLMLIVTKLDEVPISQRADVIGYIIKKLELWGMDIPVFIPYETEMPDDRFKDIIGMERIRAEIDSWISSPERVRLTENWMIARSMAVLDRELSSMRERQLLMNAVSDDERQRLIDEKYKKLSEAETLWSELKVKMLEKSNECYMMLEERSEENKQLISEKLQYEASHTNDPRKWWNDDYPYRLKIELANMSKGIESAASRRIAEDARWFNSMLEKSFNTKVLVKKDTIADKSMFDESYKGREPELEDIGKQRNVARAGTAVLSIAGAALCASIGFFPIVATMGIGTGAGIVSEKLFKNKIEKQREDIKKVIARAVPEIIDDAMNESRSRLSFIYDDIINNASVSERVWLEAQKKAIELAAKPSETKEEAQLDTQIENLEIIYSSFETI